MAGADTLLAMSASASASPAIRNPHFDDLRVVWSDEYSGQYQPVAYDQQFDAVVQVVVQTSIW